MEMEALPLNVSHPILPPSPRAALHSRQRHRGREAATCGYVQAALPLFQTKVSGFLRGATSSRPVVAHPRPSLDHRPFLALSLTTIYPLTRWSIRRATIPNVFMKILAGKIKATFIAENEHCIVLRDLHSVGCVCRGNAKQGADGARRV